MTNDYSYIINEKNVEKRDQKLAKQLFPVSIAREARKFHRQIPGYRMTPLETLPNLAHMLGIGGIYIKDEAQRLELNSFKVMGGSFAIYNLMKKLLHKENEELTFEYLISKECHDAVGDITFCSATDGNHGRGLAWAASKLGHKCQIFVHSETSKARIDAIRNYGAAVTIVEGNYDNAVRKAAKEAEKNGWYVVSDTSWEGYTEIPTWIMQGYTSMLLECQEQFAGIGMQKPSHILVQAGVGAPAGAVVGFYTALFPEDPPVFVVCEPDRAPCIYKSIKAGDGKCHSVKGDLDTIMAGLACGDPSPLAFEILRKNAGIFAMFPDYVAARGMRILSCPLKGDPFVISGESGALPLGALYSILTEPEKDDLKQDLKLDGDSTVLMINTEGNTDPNHFRRIIWDGQDPVPPEYRTVR